MAVEPQVLCFQLRISRSADSCTQWKKEALINLLLKDFFIMQLKDCDRLLWVFLTYWMKLTSINLIIFVWSAFIRVSGKMYASSTIAKTGFDSKWRKLCIWIKVSQFVFTQICFKLKKTRVEKGLWKFGLKHATYPPSTPHYTLLRDMRWHQVWWPSKSLELFCPMCCAPTFPLPVLAQQKSYAAYVCLSEARNYRCANNCHQCSERLSPLKDPNR